MSTILESLSKLEEEKSVLEKSIDLKSLVIQKEPVETELGSTQQIFGVTALLGAGLVGLWVAGVFASKVLPVSPTAPPPVLSAQSKKNAQPAPLYAGVTLASIPSVPGRAVDSQPLVPKRTAKKPKRMQAAQPLHEAPLKTAHLTSEPAFAPGLDRK